MKKLYRLKSDIELRRKLMVEFNVSESFVFAALSYRSMSKTAKDIRLRAKEMGAPTVVTNVDE